MKKLILWLQTNRHVWWSLLLLYLLTAYFLAELRNPTAAHSTVTFLDAYVPFFPPALIAYYLWYPLLGFTGFWLIARDGRGFRNYMWFLAICFTLSVTVYFLWPNGQDLRPDLSAPEGLFERLLSRLYAFDTNTNVFPSLHVSCAIGAALAVQTSPSVRHRSVKAGVWFLAVLIIASTVLVKQHAVVDIPGGAAAALLSWGAMRLLSRKVE